MGNEIIGPRELIIRLDILEETQKIMKEHKISESSKTGAVFVELSNRIAERLLTDPRFEELGSQPNDR